MATQKELKKIVSIASDQELEYLARTGCEYASNYPNMSREKQLECACMRSLVTAEAENRRTEPLWRKARRLALRNSDTLKLAGAIAAVVAICVIVHGPWL
jgi:hypothetical protein